MVRRGHELTVFTTDIDIPTEIPRGRAVDLDAVAVWYFAASPPRRLHRAPAMKAALAARVREFDLVHLHSVFLWPTLVAARAAARAHVPYLVAPRGMLVGDLLRRRGRWRKALWMRFAERRTLALAAALHVTSEIEANEARALGLELPPVLLVPNGIDEVEAAGRGSDTEAAAGLSPIVAAALAAAPMFLFLGRVNWKKGLDRLIPAMAQVPTATLAVAGYDEDNHRAELERLAVAHGVERRVRFCGPVEGADKAALLRGARALVLPSRSENFGNVVLEAMAVGRPVVVTPEVGLAPVVREEGAGLVVEGAPTALAEALAALLADPAAAERMGERGAFAAQRFAWPAVAEQMEQAYRRVLGARA
jgi:glycosyltransferase involved in cell wall biosynthesis